MKKLFTIFVGIIVVLVVLSFAKDIIIKVSTEKGIELATGLKLQIKGFKVGLINTYVGIRDLSLFNPKGFKDRTMLEMPEIYIDYNLPDIIKGRIHLEEARINLKKFVVVKNKNGELNLDSLKVVRMQKEGKSAGQEGKTKAPEIQIDDLRLKIGKVVYKDYSKGRTPSVREFNINLNERYRNIDDPYALVSLIVVKALVNTTIASLTDFDLGGLKGTISDTLKTAQKAVQETAKAAQQTVTKTVEASQKAAKDTVKTTTETIKKTTEDLGKAISLPFGSKQK